MRKIVRIVAVLTVVALAALSCGRKTGNSLVVSNENVTPDKEGKTEAGKEMEETKEPTGDSKNNRDSKNDYDSVRVTVFNEETREWENWKTEDSNKINDIKKWVLKKCFNKQEYLQRAMRASGEVLFFRRNVCEKVYVIYDIKEKRLRDILIPHLEEKTTEYLMSEREKERNIVEAVVCR